MEYRMTIELVLFVIVQTGFLIYQRNRLRLMGSTSGLAVLGLSAMIIVIGHLIW